MSGDPNTWDVLASPGAQKALQDGAVIEITETIGGVSTATGTATGDKPTLDLGGVSGRGGGAVRILESIPMGNQATPFIAGFGGVLILVAAVMLYLGRIRAAVIAGAVGIGLIAGAFYPWAFMLAALGLVAAVVLYFWVEHRKGSSESTLATLTGIIEKSGVASSIKADMKKVATKADKQNIERAKKTGA